ncbi:hypothetical protein CRM22_001942 [Opisthorchis felineus]|uniref:EF-hand domain-containing protein n=1 Tax=Opisthorchis felineus TaxID=147828 RepID=A0A4S2MER5_OPIFE|nr:hypothetical protein CRM22_001942 [Opisthorchis felineus]
MEVNFSITTDPPVFRAFDYNGEGGITPSKWIKGLSVFLRGTLEEKASFAFKAYDFNSDGILTREEMFLLLKSSLVKQPTDDDPDEGIRDLVDIVFKRLDMDRDGRVIFQDFLTAVQDDPLLLEILGPCFPEEKVEPIHKMQALICADSVSFSGIILYFIPVDEVVWLPGTEG